MNIIESQLRVMIRTLIKEELNKEHTSVRALSQIIKKSISSALGITDQRFLSSLVSDYSSEIYGDDPDINEVYVKVDSKNDRAISWLNDNLSKIAEKNGWFVNVEETIGENVRWILVPTVTKDVTDLMPRELWHVTPAHNKESIDINGLQPKTSTNFGLSGAIKRNYSSRIYLSVSEDAAERMASSMNLGKYALFKVDTSGGIRFYHDPEPTSSEEDESVYTDEAISSDDIIFVGYRHT
jgi:hypothetical protein